MIQTAPRQYMVDVRPLHRETSDSYTARLLVANFETPAHLAQLVRETTTSDSKEDRAAAERELILAKTKRSILHLDAHPSGWLSHADGTTCEFCADKLPERWMCTFCAHGAEVKQNPHFDNIVCVRHQRWIGLQTAPNEQESVGADHLEAARLFTQLRRRRLMDVRLYLLITEHIEASSMPEGQGAEKTIFPVAVRLIWALTRADFARGFFDPSSSFKEAHAHLVSTVGEVLEEDSPELVRALWLYLRPAAAALRRSILNQVDFAPAWPHDFPLKDDIAQGFQVRPEELEPFKNYLDVTNDTEGTAALYRGAQRQDRVRPAAATEGLVGRRSLAICVNGHEVLVRARKSPLTSKAPALPCATCAGQSTQRGENDLATTHPTIARQFDENLNGGVTVHEIGANTKREFYWRCRRRHSFEATVASRTYRGTGCPVCLDRVIVPGVNDIQTTHPEVAATWHPSWLTMCPPSTIAASSDQIILWVCENDHAYSMRIWDRVQGKVCPECTRHTAEGKNANLTATHPHIAAEWHPERNRRRTPDEYTSTSREKAAWLCHSAHTFYQRIDLRAKGHGCGRCLKESRISSQSHYPGPQQRS